MSAELPDAEARRRIAEDLDTNLLVEAGAGSGKTTALVGRMVALVQTGRARADQIAAVTFTRKAAAELRERFQVRLEEELQRARENGDTQAAARLDAALHDLDRAILGTIHSFCARLLREHPIEAGVDPDFEEISGADETRIQRAFWDDHLHRLVSSDDPLLAQLAHVGIRPHQLWDVFAEVSGNPDVEWPAPEIPRPEPRDVRSSLEQWLDTARALLPQEEPARGWDGLQNRVRTLLFSRRILGWDTETHFFEALETACGGAPKPTFNRWGDDKATKEAVRDLHTALVDFVQEDGPAQALLRAWYSHRYPLVLRFAQRAAEAYAQQRYREGTLTFSDLLGGAARLLRENPESRRSLSDRFQRLLIDEFQDTDPIQTEVMFLLAGGGSDQNDWREVTPRPGSLFVVGDPKQSIYRFRRADIAIYNAVKNRFRAWDGVLTLTTNFRSREQICTFANQVFEGPFPPSETEHQAAFAPLDPRCSRPAVKAQGVFTYTIELDGSKSAAAVGAADAERLAEWIASRIRRGERKPGDFLVLAQFKDPLAGYARALEGRGIPVQVTGAGVGVEEELRELLLLLQALVTPEDNSLVVAVLTGLFFGLDYEVLTQHALAYRDEEARWAPMDPSRDANGDVEDALARLGRWRHLVQTEPADVAVETIVDELGLLPHAAAGELGDTRAGALLFALDRIRATTLIGETSFAAILEALEVLLADEEAETPLEPGRTDVVRVMNLHKAKGLEAPVIVLAYPTGQGEHKPYRHIARPANGTAQGYLHIQDRSGRIGRTLARPADWEDWAAAEALYAEAEAVRLLYVAGTRAMDELVICRCAATEGKSPWQSFYPSLENAQQLDIAKSERSIRPVLERTVPEIMHEVELARSARLGTLL